MQDTIGLKPGPQYNLPELARSMAKRMELDFKVCHQFLDSLFSEEIPEVLKGGTPIIIHGFGTFYVKQKEVFNNPSTPDPTDRILKDKPKFRSHELFDLRISDKLITHEPTV